MDAVVGLSVVAAVDNCVDRSVVLIIAEIGVDACVLLLLLDTVDEMVERSVTAAVGNELCSVIDTDESVTIGGAVDVL